MISWEWQFTSSVWRLIKLSRRELERDRFGNEFISERTPTDSAAPY
jgi:hypothetical protein